MINKILILGATGMLGHALFKHFLKNSNYVVYGTIRSRNNLDKFFNQDEQLKMISGVDADNFDSFINAFAITQPDIVINCIGIIKHLPEAKDYYKSININSFLPHKLVKLCKIANARFIHISTDCVFDGKKGNYFETDNSNAEDLYGKSKYIGEVNYPNSITLRTSIIGHELNNNISLIDWFLTQQGTINGYVNAIYTGFPTYEVANIIDKFVIPNHDLCGLYHLSSNPISKYDLLELVKDKYNKNINVIKLDNFVLDRSLNSSKFQNQTGFRPKSWVQLVAEMHDKFMNYRFYDYKFKNY